MPTASENTLRDILIMENDLHSDPTFTRRQDESGWDTVNIDKDYEYHILFDGSIRIVGTHNDTHEENYTSYPENPEAAVRLMSSLVDRFHSLDYCHCSRPIYTHEDGYTRHLCRDCDMVRCDAYPEDCSYR